MRPGRIEGSNATLGKPADWDDSKGVTCDPLDIRIDDSLYGRTLSSVWHPSPEELVAMQHGAPVVLTLYGHGHPPVGLTVYGVDMGASN